MEHTALYYAVLGAGVVLAPAITDRLIKDRLSYGWRVAIGILAAALMGAAIALIARPLGL